MVLLTIVKPRHRNLLLRRDLHDHVFNLNSLYTSYSHLCLTIFLLQNLQNLEIADWYIRLIFSSDSTWNINAPVYFQNERLVIQLVVVVCIHCKNIIYFFLAGSGWDGLVLTYLSPIFVPDRWLTNDCTSPVASSLLLRSVSVRSVCNTRFDVYKTEEIHLYFSAPQGTQPVACEPLTHMGCLKKAISGSYNSG